MLRGDDTHAIVDMKREGVSVQAISELTDCDRKTVRKYPLYPEALPSYPARPTVPGKLDPHKAYLEDRLKAGV